MIRYNKMVNNSSELGDHHYSSRRPPGGWDT